jgi:hypothetical protein
MTQPSEIKFALQNFQPDEFETFVASLWSEMGWKTEITQSSRDQGVDIIATKSGIYDEKVVIQAKCYSDGNKIGRPDIQQYSTLQKQVSGADTVIVVTSSSFTNQALSLADELNVKTISGDELAQSAIQHLPEEQLDITGESGNSDSNPASGSTRESIPIDSLTVSEQDLANMYADYFRRLEENLRANEGERRLIFDLESEHGDTSEYHVVSTVHIVKFRSDSEELWLQLQKTAEKYQWEVHSAETYGTGAGGVEMIVPPNEAEVFSVTLETGNEDRIYPKRQAKISSLLLNTVYNKGLSGTNVREFALDNGQKTFSRVIK